MQVKIRNTNDLRNLTAHVIEMVLEDKMDIKRANVVNASVRNILISTSQDLRVQTANGERLQVQTLDSSSFRKQLNNNEAGS